MSLMKQTTLGRTGLTVTRTGFGVLPIQRVDMDEAVRILGKAYDAGITFYDTARGYTDSEEKMGRAFAGLRESIVIATKSLAATREGVIADLEASLKNLRTDYIDLLQLHNPSELPDPNDPESSYAGLVEAQEKGMARYIGITSHGLERAKDAVDSGLYDTLQYPLCHISSPQDLSIIDKCREANIGLIAMKPLSGGLLTNMPAAYTFLRQFENVIPIWGIQRMCELKELIELEANPPALDDGMLAVIEKDRRELANEFCRACGYCLPCPVDIPIPMAARMGLAMKRMPYQQFLSDDWRNKMHRIDDCIDCGHCKDHCPYGLDTPALLRKMLAEYEAFYSKHA